MRPDMKASAMRAIVLTVFGSVAHEAIQRRIAHTHYVRYYRMNET
jgi:hypothetical protein